jgi:hypothetical protein
MVEKAVGSILHPHDEKLDDCMIHNEDLSEPVFLLYS